MHRIEALLRKEIGLDAASIGSSLIERTIRLRMRQHGLKNSDEYIQLLRASRAEFDELIEAVVVTETWFFRDREPFTAFTQFAVGEWLPCHPEGVMRILSVPCSSGEEPYSLAMALLDAGVATERFQIDAVDISANALHRAARGHYGKNSFRGTDLEFRNRHFVAVKDGYALHHEVRRHVTFARDNVLDDGFLSEAAPYDFIFCRNLLIYFDRATQILALAKLHHLLAAEGVLFVGPAEVPLVSEGGFTSANLPHAFACRKTNPAPNPPPPPRRKKKTHQPNAEKLKTEKLKKPTSDFSLSDFQPFSISDVPPALENLLHQARQLADAGRLVEATAICEAHLAHNGTSAEAYYLLGLVKDAANDPDAIKYYRRALYLDPNHYETLVHAALCLEKAGEAAAAHTFKRRAARAQPKP
jgi:chemotaxis protein methyltransferase WspC